MSREGLAFFDSKIVTSTKKGLYHLKVFYNPNKLPRMALVKPNIQSISSDNITFKDMHLFQLDNLEFQLVGSIS